MGDTGANVEVPDNGGDRREGNRALSVVTKRRCSWLVWVIMMDQPGQRGLVRWTRLLGRWIVAVYLWGRLEPTASAGLNFFLKYLMLSR